jgi:hypothetical protein
MGSTYLTDGEYQHIMRGKKNTLEGRGEEIQSKICSVPDPDPLGSVNFWLLGSGFSPTDPDPAHSSEYHVKKLDVVSFTYAFFFP